MNRLRMLAIQGNKFYTSIKSLYQLEPLENSLEEIVQDQIILTLHEWRQIHPAMPPSWEELKRMVNNELGDGSVNGALFARSLTQLIAENHVYELESHFHLTSSGVEKASNMLEDGNMVRFEQISSRQIQGSEPISQIGILLSIAALLVAAVYLFVSRTVQNSNNEVKNPAYGPLLPENKDELTEFIPLNLEQATQIDGSDLNMYAIQDLFVIPPMRSVNDILPYIPLEPGDGMIETQCEHSSNPPTVVIGFEPERVSRIHLLINLSNTHLDYLEGHDLSGEQVARIRLVYTNGEYGWDLKAGEDLRDWIAGADGVISFTNPPGIPAWEGRHYPSNRFAVMDYQLLEVPENLKGQQAGFLVIEDLSVGEIGNINPGIMLWGITIEVLRG